jgi:serine/threonine protein kinase
MLEMLTGELPWSTISGSEEYDNLISQIGSGSMPNILDKISKATQDFLRCCFKINHMDRMTVDALLDHPFLVGLDETTEQIGWSAAFPKPLINSRPLAHWQHPFYFHSLCRGLGIKISFDQILYRQ